MIEPVVKTVEVGCGAARAFEIFTRDISTWWPLARNTVSAASGETAQSVTIEPRQGGAVFEIRADGERCEWGEVEIWEPASALAMVWHPGQGRDAATRVDVRFEELPGGRARVILTHSGWEILGDAAQARRDGYGSGWVHVFEECYSGACG